jgi:hypothetical protein
LRREQGEREKIDEKNVGRRVERDWSSERAVKRITRTLYMWFFGMAFRVRFFSILEGPVGTRAKQA